MTEKFQRRVVTVDEVAELYRIPISTQREYRARGAFAPYFRAGNRILHRIEAVEDWVKNQERAVEGCTDGTVAGDQPAATLCRRGRDDVDVESASDGRRAPRMQPPRGGDES